jgi:predicted metal-dependent phosphoesterase TrpH
VDGVTLVNGIELRVEAGDQRLDLLGYGVDPTDELEAECARIQQNRRERGRRIVDCVEERLDCSLPVEIHDGLGRPHIARAIAEVSAYSYQAAFDELIGWDCPCYVAREVPSFERGREVLADACGLVGLAHPYRYRDTAAAFDRCADLDAVERWYPYGEPVDTDAVETLSGVFDALVEVETDDTGRKLRVKGDSFGPSSWTYL